MNAPDIVVSDVIARSNLEVRIEVRYGSLWARVWIASQLLRLVGFVLGVGKTNITISGELG